MSMNIPTNSETGLSPIKHKEKTQSSVHLNGDRNLNRECRKLKRKKFLYVKCREQISFNQKTKIDAQTQTDPFNSKNSEDTSSLPNSKKMKRTHTSGEDSDCTNNRSNRVSSFNKAKVKQSSTDVDTSELDLIERLTIEEVKKIKNAINLPERLLEIWIEPVDFILYVNLWENFDPVIFFESLNLVRPDLVKCARKITYLNKCSPQKVSKTTPEIGRLVDLIRNEISTLHWKIILKEYNFNVMDGFGISKIMNFCLTEEIITKDLEVFKQSLRKVNELNLVQKLETLQNKLSMLDDTQFLELLKLRLSRKIS